MKKVVIAAVAIAILVFGAWYFASPGMAMRGLREAAVAGDKDALKERIDFPSVRESLKSQFRAHMVAEMTKQKDDNPFAALGMAMAGAIIDPMIDGMMSPDGIKAMVEAGRMNDGSASAAKTPDESNPAEWKIERKSLSEFIATPEAPAGEKVPSLVFKRDGLGWDLVEIEIPEGGLGNSSGT